MHWGVRELGLGGEPTVPEWKGQGKDGENFSHERVPSSSTSCTGWQPYLVGRKKK